MTMRELAETMLREARAQVGLAERMVALLHADETTAAAPSSDGRPCLHPPERRLEAARMGRPGGWVCGDCGHEGG